MRRSAKIVGLCAAGAVLAAWGLGLWLGFGTDDDAPEPPSEAFMLLAPPEPAPQTPFVTDDGATATLANYRGEVVVLNFWATWCAPCVRELPSLDRLAAALPEDGFEVLALSHDRGGPEKVQAFLEGLEVARLAAHRDPKRELAQALSLRGLPTTFIVDAEGRVVAKLEGAAEWDDPAIVAWLEEVGAE